MSSRKATYVSLVLLLLLGGVYLNAANNLSVSIDAGAINQSYFPKLLFYLLFILIIISLVTTFFKKEDEKIGLPNIKTILITILITVIYIALWNIFGYFYIFTFLFLIALLTLYRWKIGMNVKTVIVNFSIAIGMTLFIFIIFEALMNIKF